MQVVTLKHLTAQNNIGTNRLCVIALLALEMRGCLNFSVACLSSTDQNIVEIM